MSYTASDSCPQTWKRGTILAYTFTAVYEQDGDWWVGYIEELPGANTQGATLDEVRANLREAVEFVLEATRRE